MFDLTEQAIDAAALRQAMLNNEQCGAFTCFEGWVRRQNDGQRVEYLVYSAICVHRHGRLEVGDMAVWVGVSAGHRDAAFAACRFIIDTVKAEVPVWKQEFYSEGQAAAWLANPEGLPPQGE